MTTRLVLIGPGRLGAAFGRRLHQAGYRFTAVIGRDLQRTEEAASFIGCAPATASTNLARATDGEIILLAVPDDRIAEVVQRLQKVADLTGKRTLVHFSGLHPAAILKTPQSEYLAVSIHPLLPFADRQLAVDRLVDCPCAVEGDAAGLSLAEELVQTIGGRAFQLRSADKTLYHAAACIASNFLVSLTSVARNLLEPCGFTRQQAMDLLTPIHRATSENLLQLGPEQALTGPIVRGDRGTVERHLQTLQVHAPELLAFYRALGEQTVVLATASGRLDRETADELRRLLKQSEIR